MTSNAKQQNLYYPVFRSIEYEVVELSRAIYFSDEQVKVYSIKISELLSRCSMEIESLLKDLYRREFTSNEPESVGKAATELDSKWDITKKELLITSDNFYFAKSFAPSFAPMGYRSKSKDDYYSAYNAVKHDRAKNLHKANINTLIRALGALYILNVYYADSVLKSELFTPKTAGQAVGIFMNLGMNFKKFLDSCLLIEYSEYAYPFWQEDNHAEQSKTIKSLNRTSRKILSNEIIKNSSNVARVFNKLFELSSATITVGDMLRKTMALSKDFIDTEPAVVINTGYKRVYLTQQELQKPVNQIEDGERILYWDKTLHTIREVGNE